MSEKWLYILFFRFFPMNLPFWISQTFHEIPNSIRTVVFFFYIFFLTMKYIKKKPFYSSTLYFIYLFIFAFRFPCVKNIKTNFRFFSKDFIYMYFLYTVCLCIYFWCIAIRVKYMLCNRRTKKNICFFFCWFDFLNWQKYYRWIIFFLK